MTETDNNVAGRELLSDLMDGRLHGEARERALGTAAKDRAFLEIWSNYHLIGDALRSQELVVAADDSQFAEQVRMRIESDLRRDAQADAWTSVAPAQRPLLAHGRPAANRSFYRLFAGGIGAVVLAVVVAWFVALRPAVDEGAAQLAQQGRAAGTLAKSEPDQSSVMIRDSRLDELLAAHKQSGGPTALQRPAGFLRNAAFEGGPSK